MRYTLKDDKKTIIAESEDIDELKQMAYISILANPEYLVIEDSNGQEVYRTERPPKETHPNLYKWMLEILHLKRNQKRTENAPFLKFC